MERRTCLRNLFIFMGAVLAAIVILISSSIDYGIHNLIPIKSRTDLYVLESGEGQLYIKDCIGRVLVIAKNVDSLRETFEHIQYSVKRTSDVSVTQFKLNEYAGEFYTSPVYSEYADKPVDEQYHAALFDGELKFWIISYVPYDEFLNIWERCNYDVIEVSGI